MKAKDLPADLIREWAARQTAASAKLEGRELPKDYVRPLHIEEWLGRRQKPTHSKMSLEEFMATGWHPDD